MAGAQRGHLSEEAIKAKIDQFSQRRNLSSGPTGRPANQPPAGPANQSISRPGPSRATCCSLGRPERVDLTTTTGTTRGRVSCQIKTNQILARRSSRSRSLIRRPIRLTEPILSRLPLPSLRPRAGREPARNQLRLRLSNLAAATPTAGSDVAASWRAPAGSSSRNLPPTGSEPHRARAGQVTLVVAPPALQPQPDSDHNGGLKSASLSAGLSTPT